MRKKSPCKGLVSKEREQRLEPCVRDSSMNAVHGSCRHRADSVTDEVRASAMETAAIENMRRPWQLVCEPSIPDSARGVRLDVYGGGLEPGPDSSTQGLVGAQEPATPTGRDEVATEACGGQGVEVARNIAEGGHTRGAFGGSDAGRFPLRISQYEDRLGSGT